MFYSISYPERKIDEDIPCLRQLLHWNNSPSEGVGSTHEDLEHRLRQINRHDLANWLGKTVFKELGTDIEKSLKKPFGELGEQETETQLSLLKYSQKFIQFILIKISDNFRAHSWDRGGGSLDSGWHDFNGCTGGTCGVSRVGRFSINFP